MALKYYESPFHVTHSDEVAMKMDLSIMLRKLIIKKVERKLKRLQKK
jgi:hypothetical protein